MSKIKAYLKTTPLKPLWWKIKNIPPIKQMRSLEGKLHRYWLLKIFYPYVYRKYSKKPVDPKKVVFVEIRLPEITNSLKTLHEKVEKTGKYTIHDHFLQLSFVGRSKYDKNCLNLIKDVATAKYIFTDEASNVLACLPMRKETIYTNTWHGCGAFKKFGFSTADLIFGLGREEQLKYPYYGNYTNVTVSSPEVAWAYEEAMNLTETPDVIKPIGISRTDVFFDKEYIAKAYEKVHKEMPESIGKKIIIYAPTFRGRVANGKAPDKLDVPMLMEALGDEYVLIIKHHPLVRELPVIPKECRSFAKDVTKSMAIDDLICVADICISDYSSLIFEYSLFEKPMIFFAYDKAEYDDWRGFYYNYNEMTPGPICTENEEMIDYIKHLDERFDKQEMVDFKYKFMRSCDGHATDRLMELVFDQQA